MKPLHILPPFWYATVFSCSNPNILYNSNTNNKGVNKIIEYTINRNKQEWRLNGKLHREDGPAFILGDCQAWFLNGLLHRVDGPAYIDGYYQGWYNNGLRHRVDGPAYINGDYHAWYLNGKQSTEQEFNNRHVKELTVVDIVK